MAHDYIIIGAGSAGCVLANRLSADPDTTVLLLEAGPRDDAVEIHAPAALNRLFQTTYDWNYQTTPQHRAANRSVYWPRGRVLGGSSSINAMIYIRGSRYDYQTWRDDHGCTGWTYPDLMPYFLRAENNANKTGPYHGTGGPLHVTDTPHHSRHCQAFLDAAAQNGAARNEDFNGPEQDGVGWYQVTQYKGRRWSAADAYLHPAAARPNLTVVTNALVTRILIDQGAATGVTYLENGEPRAAYANAEVILSAGAVNSPQLLMLSGVGPADHLMSLGIDVIADSPGVGANLSDHPVVPLTLETPATKGLWEQAGPRNAIRWQLTHKGPLTSNLAEAGGFARTDAAKFAPDLQWHVLPAEFKDEGLADPSRRALTILVALVEVASRGRIRLKSSDPRHRAAVDPGYLTDIDGCDLAALKAGVRMAREIAAAPALRKLTSRELGPEHEDDETRVRNTLSTLYHPVGTCAMGGVTRPNSVTDPDLKVRGVQALRVVDASVMPVVPRGNTNAPTIAIAERAADLIAGRAPLAGYDPAREQSLAEGVLAGTAARAVR